MCVVHFWLHIPCVRALSLCQGMLSSLVALLGHLKGISKARAVSQEETVIGNFSYGKAVLLLLGCAPSPLCTVVHCEKELKNISSSFSNHNRQY